MKKTIIALAIVFVLVSFGCKTGSGVSSELVNIHKGYDALEMLPVKGLPPDSIIEKNDFAIALELKNKGAYDIEDGKIRVYGFETGYISVPEPEAEFSIEGKKVGLSEGGFATANFKAENTGIPETVREYKTPYTIRATYYYETDASAEVCINPDIYSYTKSAAACESTDITLSGGQGAPVAVTKIEQSFIPEDYKIKVQYVIHIANKGNGDVIEGVVIKDARISNIPIKCSADFVTLRQDEEKSFVCSGETESSRNAYLAPLSVKLGYYYTTKLDKKLTVKPLEQRKSS